MGHVIDKHETGSTHMAINLEMDILCSVRKISKEFLNGNIKEQKQIQSELQIIE